MAKKQIHQMTIKQWETAFPDEDACCLYLAEHRWPEFVVCPRCGNPEVKAHGTMKWNWLCNACSPSGTNYRFSHIVSPADHQTPPAKIRNANRIRGDRLTKLAVMLFFLRHLRHHRLFPVQLGEGLAFLGQTLQHRGRFPEYAVPLMKF